MVDEIFISIVIPVLNEEESIEELYKKVLESLVSYSSWEIIFVDDGSFDNSYNVIRNIVGTDKRVKAIQLFKNFGKAAALSEGFKLVKGKYVVTIDADLQDDPKEIPNLVSKLETGYDLVSGWKIDRQDPWTKTLPSKIFNFITRILTGVRIHDFNCGLKIYRKSVVRALDIYGGLHRYIPALASQKQFRITEIPVKHYPRQYGMSKYGGNRLLHGFFDLITILFFNRYIQRPLHLFGFFGLSCIITFLVLEIYVIGLKIFIGHSFYTHMALMLFGAMLFILGLWFFSIGIIAEMITRQDQNQESRIKQII